MEPTTHASRVRTGWAARTAGDAHGPQHAVPPHRRVLGRRRERRTARPVGDAHAVPRVVGARPGQPRRGGGPLDRPPDARAGPSPRSATAWTATCSATTRCAAPSTQRWRPPRWSRRCCPAAAPCTCRTARSRWTSTSTSSPPTTWSTPGTWPWPPVVTRGSTPIWSATSRPGSPTGSRSTAGPGRSARAASRTAARRPSCSPRSVGTPRGAPAHACLAAFSAAFGRGDVDAIMALMTDDCVFEATGPAPDGARHEGADAVRERLGAAVRRHPGAGVLRGGDVRRRRPGGAPLALRVGRRRRRARARPRGPTCCGSGTGRSARSSPTSRAERLPATAAVAVFGLRP